MKGFPVWTSKCSASIRNRQRCTSPLASLSLGRYYSGLVLLWWSLGSALSVLGVAGHDVDVGGDPSLGLPQYEELQLRFGSWEVRRVLLCVYIKYLGGVGHAEASWYALTGDA